MDLNRGVLNIDLLLETRRRLSCASGVNVNRG
jgi:hypothetical protein